MNEAVISDEWRVRVASKIQRTQEKGTMTTGDM